VAANTVGGELRGSILELRETDRIWANVPSFPLGRRFALQFPEPFGSAPITGTWSFGPAQGTLLLNVAAPW